MGILSTCCGNRSSFAALSRAAAKSASSRMRSMGLLSTRVDWSARTQVCARCPLMVLRNGKSYCGKPFLEKIDRDDVMDGCGCPIQPKAQDPTEHCPLSTSNRKSTTGPNCDCKWCAV